MSGERRTLETSPIARGRLDRLRVIVERWSTPGALLFLGSFLLYFAGSRGYISIIDVQIRYETAEQVWYHGTWVPTAAQVASHPAGTYPENLEGIPHSIYGPAQTIEMLPAVALADLAAHLSPKTSRHDPLFTLVGQWIFMALIVPLVAALGVFLCFRLGLLFGLMPRLAILTAISFGFGSYWWFYVKAGLQNVGVTTALLAAVVCVFESRGRISNLLLGSAALGWTLLYRQEAILMVLPLYCLFARAVLPTAPRPWRTFAALTLPCTTCGFLALLHNGLRTGSPFANPYQESVGGWKLWSEVPFEHAFGLLVGPERGFLWFSPIVLLGLILLLPRLPGRVHVTRRGLLLSIPFVLFFAFISCMNRAGSDWSWGPRFLVPLTPFLFVGLAAAVRERLADRRLVPFLVPLFSLNLILQGVFCFWPHETEIYQHHLVAEARAGEAGEVEPVTAGVLSSQISGRLRNLGVAVPLPPGSSRAWNDEAVRALVPRLTDQLWWAKLPRSYALTRAEPYFYGFAGMLLGAAVFLLGFAVWKTGHRMRERDSSVAERMGRRPLGRA